ncbi:hypothetical protein EWT25_26445 [Escherichia coli O25b:H4]|nr:hypothetical protein EWT25_26445 [Escherichia coli O25b:H4]
MAEDKPLTKQQQKTVEASAQIKQDPPKGNDLAFTHSIWHCCKVSDEAAFCLIQRPYISKTLLTRRISPRGSP